MTDDSQTPPLPRPETADGEMRRVGVELEFSGLDCPTTAAVVARASGGLARQRSPYRYSVEADEGTYEIELDTRWADPDHVEAYAGDLPDALRADVADGVSRAAGTLLSAVMPVELVCPPIPHDRLRAVIGPVRRALAAAGALGTRHSAFSGFGMHLNVEVAAAEVEHLLSVMRAYVLLDFWLRRESRLALIRHARSYVEPFPEAYKQHILAPDYEPDMPRFMDDHMRFNPTRDMELDLLPVFAAIDPDRVRSTLPDEKNSARPAFHWRLPNCRIDEPDWAPVQDWERWVTVERLAVDRDRLGSLAEAYLSTGPRNEFEARMRRFMDLIGLPPQDGTPLAG